MRKTYQVLVKGPMGHIVPLDLSDKEEHFKRMTVGQLTEQVAKRFSVGAGQENIRLIFLDKSLKEDCKLLSNYGIVDKSLIFMVSKQPGGLTA